MDERYRDSLQRHHSFLMTHLLLTDDVIQLMSSEKILPETMIRDIQDGDTKEEQNKRLLNALRLRGNKSYKRFRELMYRTGNFFVADLLWEEEEGRGGMLIDEDDLAAKFSPLMNCLHDTQRRKFLHYLDAKIREKALVLSWRERPGDRMESLSARVVDFNQERGLRDTIAGQERKIKDLESQLKTEDEKKHATRLELSSLQQQLKAQKQDHLTQLATQSRFHDANMVTITRLKNKLTNCKAKVEGLSSQITATLDGVGGGQEKKKRKRKKKGGAGTEEDAVEEEEVGEVGEEEEQETESRVFELVNNVQELLQQYLHEKEQARRSRSQQEEVLKLVNKPQCKESVVTVVKEVLKHEQKHRALVMRDIQRLSDTFRQVVPSSTLAPPTPIGVTPTEMSLHGPPLDPATLDTKHFKSQLAMLKAEAEHIQKRFQWKDSETANLRQELFAVKQRFHDYKIIASGHRPPPHHHTTPPASLSPHLVCASCGRNMLPQNRSSHPNLPNSSSHVQFSAASKRLFQDEEEHFQAEDMPPEGWDDRRGSMGRSDLDKTVVDVEEYLLDSEGPDYFGEAATLDDALIREACHLPKETVNSAVHHGGAASTKSPPVKGAAETKSGGSGGGGGESKARRDQAKTVAAWSKARVKRKLMSK